MKLTKRRWLGRIAGCGLCVGLCVAQSGCQAPPTQQEKETQYRDALMILRESWRVALENCGNDASCRAEVNRQYVPLQAALNAAYQASLANDWDEARKFNDEVRKIIDSLLAKFPDLQQVRDLLRSSIWTEDVEIGIESTFFHGGQPVYGGTASGQSAITTCLSGTVSLEGTFSTNFGGEWEDAAFSAEFTMGDCDVDPSGTGVSAIDGGSLKINIPGAGMLYGTVNASEKPKVTLDPSGQGILDITVTLAGAPTPWFYPISGDYHLVFPVTTHANGTLGVIVTPQYFRHAFPRPVLRYIDLNSDGVADNQDYAAYLTAFTAGDLSADMNFDGVLDQSDLDAWLEDFNRELNLHR